MSKKSKLYMAFAKGNVSSEGAAKRYKGVASVKVLGVNMSKDELSAAYGRDVQNDPQYVSEVEINGVKYPRVRIQFIVKTDASKCNGIEMVTPVTFNITRIPRRKADGSKTQVIDIYGRTAWATDSEIENHTVPQYTNGPANISADYRIAYHGEDMLTEFLKKLLVIPNVTKFVNNKPAGLIDNPADAEARLNNIEDFFKGDFSELREILSYQPENKVKLLFGVRTDDQNRLWQDVFINFPMTNGTKDFSKLTKELKESKDNGAYGNTDFLVDDKISDTLVEYTETPTNFNEGSGAQGAAPANPWFNNKQ